VDILWIVKIILHFDRRMLLVLDVGDIIIGSYYGMDILALFGRL
jgi:hypothetical protein